MDLKARNIRVNVLSPGTIDTPILEGVPKDAIDGFVALIPRARWDAPRRSRPPRCSWLRAIPASSRGASSSSTAASPRSDHSRPRTRRSIRPREESCPVIERTSLVPGTSCAAIDGLSREQLVSRRVPAHPPPRRQKNPAPILTVSARMVVLKKNATTQCSVVILRMCLGGDVDIGGRAGGADDKRIIHKVPVIGRLISRKLESLRQFVLRSDIVFMRIMDREHRMCEGPRQ